MQETDKAHYTAPETYRGLQHASMTTVDIYSLNEIMHNVNGTFT